MCETFVHIGGENIGEDAETALFTGVPGADTGAEPDTDVGNVIIEREGALQALNAGIHRVLGDCRELLR